jgi:O-antigen ligase
MFIDKLIILLMSLLLADFIQVISIFSDFGVLYLVCAFLLLIFLSFLKVIKKVYVESSLLLLFALLLGLAVNVSLDSNLGLAKSLAIIASVFLFLFNIRLFLDEIKIQSFINFLVLIALLKLVFFLIFVDVSVLELVKNPSETRFSYSTYFNPIYLARSCGLGVLAALFLNKNAGMKALVISFLLLGMYISGSRGPVLALLIVVFLYVLQRDDLSTMFKYLMQFFLAIIVFFALDSNLILRNNDGVESAFEDRFLLIIQAYELFTNNMLIGAGLGSFSNVSYLGHPHNIILELLSETGIVGLLIFMALVIKGLKKMEINFFGLALMYVLINAMFSGSIVNNIGVIWFSVLCYRYKKQRALFA